MQSSPSLFFINLIKLHACRSVKGKVKKKIRKSQDLLLKEVSRPIHEVGEGPRPGQVLVQLEPREMRTRFLILLTPLQLFRFSRGRFRFQPLLQLRFLELQLRTG